MDEYDYIPMIHNFIDRLHNGHIYISEYANNMIDNSPRLGIMTPPLSLADKIAIAINDYQSNCNPQTIRNLRHWINDAYSHGVIKTGSEVLSKLQEKEQRIFDLETEIELQKEKNEKQINKLQEYIKELEEKHAELSTRYVHLQGKYDELEEKFGRMLPKDKGDNLFHE